ncbi:MAG TPA: hypothetical protein PKA98_17310, partial [Acidimicrobiales bacterium]|nr:hypothetical protein [Acidimicrobiales bacterium]
MESTDLERAALERKDRDELQTIAEAMGGKPGSRARKGEIIDLILELAGVTESASAGEPAPAGDAAEAEREASPATATDAASGAAVDDES